MSLTIGALMPGYVETIFKREGAEKKNEYQII